MNHGSWTLCGAVVVLALLAGAGMAAENGVQVQSTEETSNGIHVVLSLQPAQLSPVPAKDGKTYTKVVLPGCGNDNVVGRPALPIVSHTAKIPWGTEVQVSVREENARQIAVEHWIYPHQPPRPKVAGPAGDPPFVIDLDYYSGAKASGLQKAFAGAQPVVTVFKKRGEQFVNVLVRPFAYNPQQGVVQYPTTLDLDLAWTPSPLPKAAGPRLGTITVVEITLTDPAQLAELTKAGYDIANRQGNIVTIYATDAEIESLRQSGYALREIEKQPRPKSGGPAPPEKGLGVYHTYATLTSDLEAYAAAYPAICRLSSLGQSFQGRELWAMQITANPDLEEDEPEVKYVGSMHGDEPIGMEMCVYFIDFLLTGYGTDPRGTALVDDSEIWIVPLMNPDGLAAGTRYNAQGVDLNRSFPEGAQEAIGNALYGPAMTTAGRPPEVVRVMQWSYAHDFALSANFHGGALLVNYPYDNDGRGDVDSPTPDDLLFEALSEVYSSHNTPMWNSLVFTHGITNGAAWYSLVGGMQDWNYRYMGCNEVTIELGAKTPLESQLPQLWSENQESMLAYFESAQGGVRGIVTDAATDQPLHAAAMVLGKNHLVFTDPDVGDYHRLLLPGTYDLMFTAPGYCAKTINGVVVNAGNATRLDVTLQHSEAAQRGVVVVSNASMALAAGAFRAEKAREGFQVYDLTITGSPTADTVRSQIRTVYNAFHPEYAVILGDTQVVPTFTSTDGYASDLLYALMDPLEGWGDYLGKDLLVGRVSVDTAASVSQYVDKLAAFVANRKHRNLTWISNGNDSSQYDIAEGTHNWVMANALPSTYDNTLFYRSNGSAAELTAHINAGTDGVIYSGHGGWDGWSRYYYDVSELPNLTNALDAPIVLGHCCDTGMFNQATCFAEAWMETTGRGIVYVGASANSYWDEDDVLEKQEFTAMQDTPGLAIGDAVEHGLESVYTNYPVSAQYYFTIYHVFGDPTVSLFGEGALAISTPRTLPLAYQNEPYNLTVSVLGGEPPYTWSMTGGALPDGLTFDPDTHTISGTSTATGAATFTLEVTDAALTSDVREFTLSTVQRFGITSSTLLPTALVGQPYTVALQAQGGTPPAVFSLATIGSYAESVPSLGWLGGGTPQGWQADDNTWPLALPWPFWFYGTEYTSLYVSSNGFLDFASGLADYNNNDWGLRDNVRIAPLWDDLSTTGAGNDIFITQTADYVAVRWAALTFADGLPVNVEAVLYRTGLIRFNYGAAHAGLSPTIGISNGNYPHYVLSQRDNDATIPANVSSDFTYTPIFPPGFSFTSEGVISGTPSQVGQFEFTVLAHDSGQPQQSAQRQFTLPVEELHFSELPRGGWYEVGMSLTLSVVVEGGTGSYTYLWGKDEHGLSEETSSTLTIDPLTLEDQGWYTCRVSDGAWGYETPRVYVQVFPAGSLPAAGAVSLGAAALMCILLGARRIARRRR